MLQNADCQHFADLGSKCIAVHCHNRDTKNALSHKNVISCCLLWTSCGLQKELTAKARPHDAMHLPSIYRVDIVLFIDICIAL